MYQWIAISTKEQFDDLWGIVDSRDFAIGDVIDWLKRHMSAEVGGMLVEHPYTDKDYRSTFYHYYAKKGASYSPHCVRLHFFRQGWSMAEGALALTKAGAAVVEESAANEDYLGYVVVRPTRINTIGRTLLNPSAVEGAKGWVIQHRHKAHVLGYRVQVEAFPFMQQHTDIAVCAHTACWAILRHYSERYALYREVLVHDISKLGREFDPGGLLPSLGITARDAQRIFAAVGTYPLLVVRRDAEDGVDRQFQDELLAYLDSGFPLFGVQTGRGHALAVIGYRRSAQALVSASAGVAAVPQAGAHPGRAWDYISHLMVADDNHYPYLAVGRTAIDGVDYSIDDFDAFIVPLPEKMFLPAAAALEISRDLTDGPPEHFDELESDKTLVRRCFVTTTASWHRFVRRHASQLPEDFVSVALELTMPQFIWVVEYASPGQWAHNTIQARLLLDATAGTYDPFPAFLLHDAKGALWIDRANNKPMVYQTFDAAVSQLQSMESNLREYK
jgi:hypothetical protein